MSQMQDRAGLRVATALTTFIETRALTETGIAPDRFWRGLADIFARFTPENRALLAERDRMQASIDQWHEGRRDQPIDAQAYHAMLRDIGYLVSEPAAFEVNSAHVDAEIATMAGPQLVVPVLNDRFLLNAANARWGSLYDALYGTDALPGKPASTHYDAARGAQVIERAKAFLDEAIPLAHGKYSQVTGWQIVDGACYPR